MISFFSFLFPFPFFSSGPRRLAAAGCEILLDLEELHHSERKYGPEVST